MKKIILIGLFSIVFSGLAISQPWLSNMPENKSESDYSFFDYQNAFNKYWSSYEIDNGWYFDENGQKQKAYGWKQFKRWEYFWQYRVNPKTGDFPNTNAGLEYKKYVEKHGEYKSNDGNWTCLGTNTSPGGYAGIGRVATVAFHPSNADVFWIGAPAGGLWGTTDGGNSWNVFTDNNDVLGVSAIVISSDYDVSNTIYIGTGDRDARDNYSVGVLKSTDGGITWLSTGLTFTPDQKKLVNNMRINPEDDNTIYAATSNGFYITNDAAVSWTRTFNSELVDIELCPNYPDTIYGSTRGGDIYRSVDGGQNWDMTYSSAGNARVELAVTADNPSVVYAIGANGANGLYAIFKSTDFGENFDIVFDDYNMLGWYNGTDAGGQGWYDLSMAADPNDEDIVYIGGVNTWKSTDGGLTWALASHWYGGYGAEEVHADKHYMAYRNNESVLFEGNDGGIYSCSDGVNWDHHTNGIAISQIYGLSTAQTVESRTIVGLQDNGTKQQDGANWYDVLGGDGMKCLIDYENEDIQYGSFYYGDIYRTVNNWSSSTGISDNIPGGATGAWVTPFVLDPIDHNTIYVGFDKLWKSTDKGNTFENIGSFGGNLNSIAICGSNSNYIYVGRSNSISKTTNGGQSWETVSGLPLADAPLTYIEVKYNDPNTVWVTLGEFNEHVVYETTNGGDTWTNISAGLPNIPANCIIQNKLESTENQLYIGTDFGVYIKKGDADWTLFSNGLPNVVVSELDIYYDLMNPENSRLRASTYGRGLWESDLNLSGNYAPFVSTGDVQNIDESSATLSGEVVNDFGSNVSESGILVSLNPSPFIGGESVIQIASSPNVTSGQYSVDVDGLTAGTTYYYRAYAINENGEGYGGDYNFATACGNIKAYPWTDGAEYSGEFPNCFSNEIVSGPNFWEVSDGNIGFPDEAYAGNYNYLISGGSSSTGVTRLVLPTYEFGETTNASVGFWIYNAPLFSFLDEVSVMYRENSSSNWINLETIDYGITEWTYMEVNLPNLSDEYQIAFEANILGGRGICLDELYVGEPLYDENNLSNKIQVSPNPSTGIFNVKIDNVSENILIEVFDVSGRNVFNLKDVKIQNIIDLSGYNSGVYVLKISSDSNIDFRTIIIE